jgi:hypothetical protein
VEVVSSLDVVFAEVVSSAVASVDEISIEMEPVEVVGSSDVVFSEVVCSADVVVSTELVPSAELVTPTEVLSALEEASSLTICPFWHWLSVSNVSCVSQDPTGSLIRLYAVSVTVWQPVGFEVNLM